MTRQLKNTTAGIAGLAMTGLLLTGCPSPPLPSGGDGQRVSLCPTDSPGSPASLVAGGPPQQARVYFDVSGSMQGFAESGSTFSQVLSELRPLFLDFGINKADVWKVGVKVEPTKLTGFSRWDDKQRYKASETNLAAALRQEAKLGETSPALTVIVSDGVTSLDDDRPADGRTLSDCEQGSDVDCLVVELKKLYDLNTGFWIVGLRGQFKGTLYSEVSGTSKSLGPVDQQRPFYLWVLADHPPTARTFIQRLIERLEFPLDLESTSFAIEIFPGETAWRTHHGNRQTESSRALLPLGTSLGGVLGPFTPSTSQQSASIQVFTKDLRGDAFGLRIPLETPTGFEAYPSITSMWSYNSSYCLRWQPSQFTLPVEVTAQEDGGDLEFALISQALRQLIEVEGELFQRLEKQRQISGISAALSDWSTRNDSNLDDGSKTFNLVPFLSRLETRLTPPEFFEHSILRVDLNP